MRHSDGAILKFGGKNGGRLSCKKLHKITLIPVAHVLTVSVSLFIILFSIRLTGQTERGADFRTGNISSCLGRQILEGGKFRHIDILSYSIKLQ